MKKVESSRKMLLDLDYKFKPILRELWRAPLSSRSDIAERTKIDPSTISRTMASMLKLGLVLEVEEGSSGPNGGRKPVNLIINDSFGVFGGIEVASEFCDYTLITFDGRLLHKERIAYPKSEPDFIKVCNRLISYLDEVSKSKGFDLLGIGFGIPGLVDEAQGIIIKSLPLQILSPLSVRDKLIENFQMPIAIENDVRCCCHAELSLNRKEPMGDFLYVLGEFRDNMTVNASFHGIALGMGLVLNGQVHAGQRNTSGEFRSSFFEEPRGNNQFSIPDHELKLLETDKIIQSKFASELGKNIAVLVNVLNTPKVVIGGSLLQFGDEFINRISHHIIQNMHYSEQGPVHVYYSPFGDNAVSYGAAANLIVDLVS